MNIIPYIKELLFYHECVIVPGFGAILGNFVPARIDNNNSTIYPPRKLLSFNRNLQHNDGLLIGKISGETNISYPEARKIVDDFVITVKKRLGSGETVGFDQIGSFNNNHEGNIQFEPDISSNYHLGSYGLEPFRFGTIEGYSVREKAIMHGDKEPIRSYSRHKILWRAAVVVPIIALIAVIPFKTDLFKSDIEVFSLNPLATTELNDNRLMLDQPEISENMEPLVNTIPEKYTEEPVTSINYNIITGSFKVRDNAVTHAEMLSNEGFIPEIIEASNGFFRVSAGSFDNLQTANYEKNRLGRSFPDAWISRTK